MAVFIHHLTLETARRLAAFLDQPWPPRHIDRDAHDLRMRALADLISREGGAADEHETFYSVKIGGIRATSTSGLIGATRNWINSVRKKAEGQTAGGAVR